jgi:hypothetical protein
VEEEMTAQPPPPSRHQPTSSEERNYRRIRVRQDTDANWRIADPILATGEFAYTIAPENSPTPPDPGQCIKIGDGITPWTNLPYLAAQGSTGPAGPPGNGIQIKGVIDYVGPPTDPPTDLSSSEEGDVWIDSNGDGWVYSNGNPTWTYAGPIRGANFEVYIQETEPTPVLYGAMWFKLLPAQNMISEVYVWDTVQWILVLEPSLYTSYVFKPTVGTVVISGADVNGNTLAFNWETLSVSVNGVEIVKGEDYVEGIAGQEIELTSPILVDGDVVSLSSFTTFSVSTIDSVVYADKPVNVSVAGNAVTVSLDVADTPDISNGTPLMMVDAKKLRAELDTMIHPSERTSFDPLNPPTSIVQAVSNNLNLAVRDLDAEVARLSNADTMACTYSAATNLIEQVTAAGSAIVPPFVVGQDLPAPVADYKGYYAYVTADGTYGGNAVRLGDSIGCDGTQWIIFPFSAPPAPVSTVFGRIGDITPVAGDYIAEQVTYDPSNTTLSSNTTQGALDELAQRTPVTPVSTVFGRNGDVVAEPGDYSATLVTYDNSNTSLISGSTQDAITELSNRPVSNVASVHGRDGAVVGESGDYSAPLVFFDPSGLSAIGQNSTDVDLAIRDLDQQISQLSQSQVLVGTFDGATDTVSQVSAAGVLRGYSAGDPLPAPAPARESEYLLVISDGTANGDPVIANDRLWCDGVRWIVVTGGGGASPVTSVFGRVGDIAAVSGDYSSDKVSYTGTAAGANVKAALDSLASRITALEARPYLLGGFNRSGNDADGAWFASGTGTGNRGQLNRHSAYMATRSWGDHGVTLSGNDITLTKTGNYLINVRTQIGDSTHSNIVLEVDGQYTNSYLRNGYNQDAAVEFQVWYRKTTTSSTVLYLNRFGGGSFDFWTPSTTISRFSL